MKKLLVLLFVLLLVAPAMFAADQPAIPRAGETIEVSIVNLEVVVTDKHGQRVHGLTKDDFEVFEDGKPQPISNFAAYTTQPASTVLDSKTGVSLPATAPKRQRRTIAVFIEAFRLPENKVAPIFTSLKHALQDVIAPGDAVLIASWNLRTVVRLDYTDDLATIDATLDKIAKESAGGVFDPLTTYQGQIEELQQWFTESAAAAAAHNLPVDAGAVEWATDTEAQSAALSERVHMREKAQAINSLISTMSNDDGRKALIMVTRRFSHIAGGEYFFVGGRSGLEGMLEQQRNATYDIRDMIKNTANAHNVTIYALYPPGLEYSNISTAQLRNHPAPYASGLENRILLNELDALKDLTDSTGGTTSWGTVNIVDDLPRLRDDFEDYYSLAYRVGARNDNRARHVAVKTKNSAYVVRTRKEFMEKNDDGRVRDQVIASLFRDPAPGGIEVTATIGKAEQKEKHHFTLPVSVRMPVNAFMTSQDGNASKGAFTVYIATGRYVGETSEITKHTIPFTVADVQQAKDGYFTYDFTLMSDFATNRLAIGVYDEVSHDSGFARVNLY